MALESRHEDFGIRPTPVSEETLATLKSVSVTTITGVLARLGMTNCYMRDVPPRTSNQSFAGTAFTMRTVPTREDVVEASKGRESLHRTSFIGVGQHQCLVFDARGEQETGVLGDIYAAQIKANGGVALVTDGCTRDVPEMEEVGLPIFARGVSGNAFGTRHLAADQNVPIQCGGVLVLPGDVLVGSPIGVVVIPSALAEKVAEIGSETDLRDAFSREKVLSCEATVEQAFPLREPLLSEYEAWKRTRM
jgi:regulator of RNase E activity RraA